MIRTKATAKVLLQKMQKTSGTMVDQTMRVLKIR